MAGIQIGDRVGDYEVVGLLGRGGMGKVFRVRSLLSGREEAMKVVHSAAQDDADLAARFLREIQVHASLDHPNIAALRAALRHEDQIVMILELVQGVSLEERLRSGPLPVATAVHYVGQVLSALALAHSRGVVHRDIKPANILIAAGDVVKLTDFGIARSGTADKLTRTGFALGSLPYMSPEQIRLGPVDARSDIYALGITFYEAVTGLRPIHGDSEYSLMEAQLTRMPPPPSEVIAHVPAAVSAAIMKALAKEPGKRFQSATEFHAALAAGRESLERAEPPAAASGAAAGIAPEELARVESKLVRVLGPIAAHMVRDASRRCANLADLCQNLAAQIPELEQRRAFLSSALAGTTPTAAGTSGGTAEAAPQWSADFLGRLEQALAACIGPIAKVVVKRAAKRATTAEDLYAALCAEIPSEVDRRKFLAAIRPAGSKLF
jgi:hypothetical protein